MCAAAVAIPNLLIMTPEVMVTLDCTLVWGFCLLAICQHLLHSILPKMLSISSYCTFNLWRKLWPIVRFPPNLLRQMLQSQDLYSKYLVQGLQIIAFERQCQYRLLLGRFKADQRKLCELWRLGTTPCVSTLCLPNVIYCDWISQALPLHFYILKAIINCCKGRPRNEAHHM